MLRWRLACSAVIISVLFGLAWLDFAVNFGRPGIWLCPVGLAIAGLAAGEVLGMLRAQNVRPISWTVYAGTLAVVLAACFPVLFPDDPAGGPLGQLGWPLVGLAVGTGLACAGELGRFRRAGTAVVHLSVSVFTVTYVGLLTSFLVALRLFHDNRWGMAALGSMVVIVKLSDSGAYAVGRAFGKYKMAPLLSPGKTIEGAIGGLLTACASSWLVFRYLIPLLVGSSSVETPFWRSILYGLVVATAGMLGDLVESLLKRDSGCKDSSSWMPGLGGVLDVVDSVLAAAPAAFVCWAAGLVGP